MSSFSVRSVSFTAEILCSRKDLNIALCNAIKFAGLEEALNHGKWTIFAPTNQAFVNLPPTAITSLYTDAERMKDAVLFHAVSDRVLRYYKLPCRPGDTLIEMANGDDSRTICDGDSIPTYQKGALNPDEAMPRIIEGDVEACNGVIHIVDKVMRSYSFPVP